MNVVFFTRLYYPHIGGVEKHVQKISETLSQKHNITIITEQYDSSLPLDENLSGIKIFRIPVVGVGESTKKWAIWAWLWKHWNLLDQADILHAHDVYFWLFIYKFFRPFKKTYVTFHGWETQYPIPLKNKIIRKASELLSDGNICVGDFIAKWYDTKPTLVTYGAV